MIEGELFDKTGCIAVWGKMSSSGQPYYTFNLTNNDRYILFPQHHQNPKAPKFVLKKADASKREEVE